MFRRFLPLAGLAFATLPVLAPCHPGHDSPVSKLRPDASVLRGESGQFKVEIKYNPFPLSRRAELVFFTTRRDGQKVMEPSLQGVIFPGNDTTTSETLFFRKELHNPEILFAKPLLIQPVPHTLLLQVGDSNLTEEIRVEGLKGEGANKAVVEAQAEAASAAAAPTAPQPAAPAPETKSWLALSLPKQLGIGLVLIVGIGIAFLRKR